MQGSTYSWEVEIAMVKAPIASLAMVSTWSWLYRRSYLMHTKNNNKNLMTLPL